VCWKPSSSCWSLYLLREVCLSTPIHSPFSGSPYRSFTLGCARPQPSHPHSLHKTTTTRRPVHRISRHGVALGTTARRRIAGWSSALSWHSKFRPLHAGVHGGSHQGGDEWNLHGNMAQKPNIARMAESSRLEARRDGRPK
jgi:hypothetical protein